MKQEKARAAASGSTVFRNGAVGLADADEIGHQLLVCGKSRRDMGSGFLVEQGEIVGAADDETALAAGLAMGEARV